MNGMGHVEKLNQYFPKERLLGGTALIGTVLNKAGDVDFIGPKGAGSMNIANETEKPDEMTHKIVAEFQKAGLNPNLTKNFLGTLMAKVVFNSVINTLQQQLAARLGKVCGYDDCNYFMRQFRNFTGLTPAQYRKQL